MTLTPELLDAMVEQGLTREQIVALAKVGIAEQQATVEAKEAARLAKQNERQQRRRRFKAMNVTPVKCDEAGHHAQTVTKRDAPAPSLDGLPPSPTPQPPTLNPFPTPVSDADASAEAGASPSRLSALSTSDRVWIEFPAILADMSNRSDKSVRTWIGKLLAKYPAEDVHAALSAAVGAGTGDPFGYTMRILNPIKPKAANGASHRHSTADLWAADAADAHQSLTRGRHDERPFDTELDDWHRPGGSSGGRHDGPLSQPSGGDTRGLPPLRLVRQA